MIEEKGYQPGPAEKVARAIVRGEIICPETMTGYCPAKGQGALKSNGICCDRDRCLDGFLQAWAEWKTAKGEANA